MGSVALYLGRYILRSESPDLRLSVGGKDADGHDGCVPGMTCMTGADGAGRRRDAKRGFAGDSGETWVRPGLDRVARGEPG